MSNPKPCPFCGHAGEAAVNSDAVRCRWHVGWQPRVDWDSRPIEDRLQLQLDAIIGLATAQPGSDPSLSDPKWSPALGAVKALVRERDSYRRAYETAQRLLDGRVAEAEALAGERDEVLARVAVLEAALVGLLGAARSRRSAQRTGWPERSQTGRGREQS